MPDGPILFRVNPTFAGNLIDLGIAGQGSLFTVDQAGNITTAGGLTASGSQTFPGGATIGAAPTKVTNIAVYAPTLTPAAAAASIGFAEQTFTVNGLATNDKVFVNGPAPAAAIAMVAVRVSAANTLAITFFNSSAAANTPSAGTYTIVAIRS